MYKKSIFGYRSTANNPFESIINQKERQSYSSNSQNKRKQLDKNPGIPFSATKLRRVMSTKFSISKPDFEITTKELSDEQLNQNNLKDPASVTSIHGLHLDKL